MLRPAAIRSACASIGQRFRDQVKGSQPMDVRTMALLALALLSATAPLELSQLAFAMVGAIAYALIQALQLSPPRLGQKGVPCVKAAPVAGAACCVPEHPPAARRSPQGRPGIAIARKVHAAAAAVRQPAASKPEFRQPSSRPIPRPTFKSIGWDAEVQELLGIISPSPQGDKVVRQLAAIIKQQLSCLIPEVEVLGFASGDLVRGTAFGVAVPEVDIVASASPDVLARRVQGRLSHRATLAPSATGAPATVYLDARKLQKSAIRYCTDRLVGGGSFKFRRSAFRGQEPKVTLLASASLGIFGEAIPIDFSVNSTTPLYNAALMTECGQMEPRARSLILLVKRWAKDRGVCHAAKGHLSPYAWTLLAIYFLQVGVPDSGPLLPPLEGFEVSSSLAGHSSVIGAAAAGQRSSQKPKWTPPVEGDSKKSVAKLFKEFLHFYAKDFDFRNEAVSVRLGKRAPPDLALPLHIIIHEDGSTTEVAPSIEDPFDAKRNLGECSTSVSLARLREELTRAQELAAGGGSLAALLEPWVPPERGTDGPENACLRRGGAGACDEEEDEACSPERPCAGRSAAAAAAAAPAGAGAAAAAA